MDCYDKSTNTYYPHHQEYVGPRNDLRGLCCRCMEVTDKAERKAGLAAMKRADAEEAARKQQVEDDREAFAEHRRRRTYGD